MVKDGYKQTEICVIPEDWKPTSLGEIFHLVNGFSFQSEYFSLSGPIVLTPGNFKLEGGLYFNDRNTKRYSGLFPEWTVFQKGDLLVVMTDLTPDCNLLGKPAFVDLEEIILHNQRIGKLNILSKEIDKKFLYFLLLSDLYLKKIKEQATGSTVRHTSNKSIYSVSLPIPRKIEEQRAIAQALSDVDVLVTSLDKLIAKKRAIKTATMQQLLTGKKRLPGFGERKGYKQTEIGLIPEDWKYLPLRDFITEFRGGAPLKPSDFTKSGVKVLPKGGVIRGGFLNIDEKDLQFCSQEYANKYSKNQVDESYTIVVLRDLVPSGPSIGLIVKIGRPEKYVLAQGVYGFKVHGEIIPEYLIQYSNSLPYRRLMNEIMVGSTQVHITNTMFQAAKLPFPGIEEQCAIATVLSDMDTETAALETRLAKTQAIKQGMMQELLTGRTRLV